MATTVTAPDLGLSVHQLPDLTDAKTRTRLSPAAVTAFFSIVEKWKLKSEDAMSLFGGISNGRYYELKRKQQSAVLTEDELTRVSLLIGIYKALHILFSDRLADQWVQLPNRNPMFGNATPLTYLTKGGILGLFTVRRFLDSRRGGQ